MQLLLRLAEQLHRYGTPSHRVEGTLTSLGAMLDLDVSIFCVPTMIEVAVGRGVNQRSLMLRVEPGAPDLARVESAARSPAVGPKRQRTAENRRKPPKPAGRQAKDEAL